MQAPSIEMRWGGGKWPNNIKKAVRPWVYAAIGITGDSLSHWGVSFDEPKQVTVFCVGDKYPDLGSAEGVSDVELYLPYKMTKRRKLGRHLIPLALTVLHETVHCIREESVPQNNLLERAASEGIASWAEHVFASELLSAEEIEIHGCDLTQLLPLKNERDQLMHLHSDAAFEDAFAPDSPVLEDLYGKWFDATPQQTPAGTLLGISAVNRLMMDGASVAELMSMPTEQIITVEAGRYA